MIPLGRYQTIEQRVAWLQQTCVRLLLAATSVTSLASAEDSREAKHAADVLFDEGKAALKAGRWDLACERFQRSLSLDPSPSTLVKIARCHEREGKWRAAISSYERALQMISELPRSDAHAEELAALARSAKQGAESRQGHVSIRWSSDLAGARVLVDGEPFDVTLEASTIPLDPGEHALALQVDGYDSEPLRIGVGEGEFQEVKFELRPKRKVPASGPPSATVPLSQRQTVRLPFATPAAPSKAGSRQALVSAGAATPVAPIGSRGSVGSQRVVGYVIGGVGLSALGVAAYFGYRAQSLTNESQVDGHCDAGYVCDSTGLGILRQASRAQTEALVFAAGGTVLLGAGIVLVLGTPAPKKATAGSALRLSLRLAAGSAAVGGVW